MTTIDQPQLSRIIREAELPAYTGLKKSQINNMIEAGEFPAPIRLTESGRAKGWLETEITQWQLRRAAARVPA
jgi:predicted DNA-binding transcriptional regulator AlpA